MKSQSILLSAALFSSAALAQQPPEHSFEELDVDGNGSVNREEAQLNVAVAQRFGGADANRDGKLTADEFNSAFTVRQPEPTIREPPPTPDTPPEPPIDTKTPKR